VKLKGFHIREQQLSWALDALGRVRVNWRQALGESGLQ
jgi:hypothetical protein